MRQENSAAALSTGYAQGGGELLELFGGEVFSFGFLCL